MSAAVTANQKIQQSNNSTATTTPTTNIITSTAATTTNTINTLPATFIITQNCLDATTTSSTGLTHMLKNEIENSANQVLAECYANENEKIHEVQTKPNEKEAQIDRQDTAIDGTTTATLADKINALELELRGAVENNNTTQGACSNECQFSSAQKQLPLEQELEQTIVTIEQQQQESQAQQQQHQQPVEHQPKQLEQYEESIPNSSTSCSTSNITKIVTANTDNSLVTTINETPINANDSTGADEVKNTTEVPTESNSPRRKSSVTSSAKLRLSVVSSVRADEDTLSKSSDTSGDSLRSAAQTSNQDLTVNTTTEKFKSNNSGAGGSGGGGSRLSERAKKKSWYNVLYPNYKSRAEDFKKLFKEVPNDERLIVDYSCALQRDILVQGRLYVSQNYVCFHANIFRWETYVCLKWKDVTSITKEKTALVIPNAILICTAKEKYFFATFTSRDKSFLMLFRVWQNTLMNKQMLPQEIWQWVHSCYGDELGLTSDDEDYIDPTSVPAESEVDLEFASALDDSSSQKSISAVSDILEIVSSTLDYSTANSNSNQSINQTENTIIDKSSNNRNQNSSTSSTKANPNPNLTTNTNTNRNSGNSSASSGVGGVKSKTKSYFFGSRNNSASASGSDNKASDNNSQSVRSSKSQMKVNAKELTLESIKPTGSSMQTASSSNGMADGKDGKESKASAGGSGGAAYADGKRKAQQSSKHNRPRDDGATKNSELSPTDNSDSSDSEQSKAPFVSTAECTSTHEGRQFMHTILPIHIDTLFNLLFSKSKFLVDFHEMRKSTDTNFGEWKINEEGRKQRIVNVTVQLSASVGPKTSKVTEEQEMRECSKPGELYSIDINSVNAGIPYADSFSVLIHYCLVRTVDDHTMLSVHAQIKYKKSIWGVVKGFIEKNTWAGLEDFFTALLHALQNETCLPPAKGKGRRPRRGTASQIRPLEEITLPQVKAEPSEIPAIASPTPMQVAVKAPPVVTISNERGSKSKWLSVFVIVMLCFLILLNVVLLMKLWNLEARIEDDLVQRQRMPNLSSLKKLPNTHEEWIDLLRQQEILHETELKRWHTVLQTAIELLRKTEKTLAALLFR